MVNRNRAFYAIKIDVDFEHLKNMRARIDEIMNRYGEELKASCICSDCDKEISGFEVAVTHVESDEEMKQRIKQEEQREEAAKLRVKSSREKKLAEYKRLKKELFGKKKVT